MAAVESESESCRREARATASASTNTTSTIIPHRHRHPPSTIFPTTMTSLTATATYASPHTTHTLSAPLPPTPSSTASRVAYLGAMHTALKTLQADTNALLTQKMADDAAGARDDKEEANYGEEVVEED
ncbi:hypothetical protein C7974DRAFT_415962 [Boeremia exigua]|uniref:uncharacterized protein n=1 Tax=Boeremia exigua TaxID=749465 RepID=UPI001E8EED44|nr:uncharacterized protein C7974DRAFT_415962 [Boeremia exigua]KAH6618600.1 hypothetical protein C7974DRAFT_415962 [Boeremia exigua]